MPLDQRKHSVKQAPKKPANVSSSSGPSSFALGGRRARPAALESSLPGVPAQRYGNVGPSSRMPSRSAEAILCETVRRLPPPLSPSALDEPRVCGPSHESPVSPQKQRPPFVVCVVVGQRKDYAELRARLDVCRISSLFVYCFSIRAKLRIIRHTEQLTSVQLLFFIKRGVLFFVLFCVCVLGQKKE